MAQACPARPRRLCSQRQAQMEQREQGLALQRRRQN